MRTPGVEIGRVEVLPAFNPELPPNAAGDAPGAVTLMVIPRSDPLQPDAPRAGPALPERDLPLPRSAPAGHHGVCPARADLQADLDLGRHRRRGRA